ncbi:hypothetical protein, partial [uncultured Akkermansia sp.]|uniref:hypothetical protein n=1 Tax=uncultured Akkermansia sp. TaxID=512294 RepID=UPI0025F1EF21
PLPFLSDPLKENSDSSDGEDDEKSEDEEEWAGWEKPGMESGRHPAEDAVAVRGPDNFAIAAETPADIVVAGGDSVSLEEGYGGTVRMEGDGDIFLDSANVSDDGNKEKHYGVNIRMDGGSGAKVYLGFTSSTARTAFLEGTISGTGTLVFENTSRSRVSIFDLTGADMNGFSGVVQAAAPRSSLSSEG